MQLKKYVVNLMKKLNNYKTYKDYLLHQAAKTTDPYRREKWLGKEWDIKLDGFKKIFIEKEELLKECRNVLCVGARTGQEVVALKDLGYHAVGIDLIPCAPHVIHGDMHNLEFENNSFDCVFSNVFDHSLHPEKKCSEIERVLSPDGVIIMQFQLNVSQDKYTEVEINSLLDDVVPLFDNCTVVSCGPIAANFAAMNHELVLRKNLSS